MVYGAFFGGVAGMLLFVRKHRLPLLALCDLMAPSMMLGSGHRADRLPAERLLLRRGVRSPLGDHVSGRHAARLYPALPARSSAARCTDSRLAAIPMRSRGCWPSIRNSPADRAGLKPGDLLQGINGTNCRRPAESLRRAGGGVSDRATAVAHSEWRTGRRSPCRPLRRRSEACRSQPTQIYSTIDALMLCLLLLAYDPFRRRDGELLALMMSIYPVTRFFDRKSAERRGGRARHGHEHLAERQPAVVDLCRRVVVLHSPSAARAGIWAGRGLAGRDEEGHLGKFAGWAYRA